MKEIWHQVFLARTGQLLAARVTIASTWGARMIGLLGHRALADGEALFLPGCRSIHTWGMRFTIDALFVDRAWRVVAVHRGLKPWRFVAPVWGACGVVEVRSGVLEEAGVRVGDQCHLRSTSTVEHHARG